MSHKEPPDPLSYLTEPFDDIGEFFDEIVAAAKARDEFIAGLAAAGGAILSALPGGDAIKAAIRRELNPIVPAPAGASAAKQYWHYQKMLEARGYTVDPNTPTVVAMRGMTPAGGGHATTSAASYDDTIVVLNRDAKGQPVVTTLAGSTHPGQTTASVGGTVGVPDVNGDGKADVGMIHPGEYRLVPHGDHAGAKAWDVRTPDGSGQIPGVRDTNQDGQFSKAEGDASESRKDVLTGVMIHQGGATTPWSAGCINLSQNSTVYPEFIKAAGGSAQNMKLVVLDANRD
jgi:hypothetical protein